MRTKKGSGAGRRAEGGERQGVSQPISNTMDAALAQPPSAQPPNISGRVLVQVTVMTGFCPCRLRRSLHRFCALHCGSAHGPSLSPDSFSGGRDHSVLLYGPRTCEEEKHKQCGRFFTVALLIDFAAFFSAAVVLFVGIDGRENGDGRCIRWQIKSCVFCSPKRERVEGLRKFLQAKFRRDFSTIFVPLEQNVVVLDFPIEICSRTRVHVYVLSESLL